MGIRVPIRIYKISDSVYSESSKVDIPIEDWKYIKDKTLKDVIGRDVAGDFRNAGVSSALPGAERYGFIDISNVNIDGGGVTENASGSVSYTVYFNTKGYFIVHNNEKYYFRPEGTKALKASSLVSDNTSVFEFYVNPERITPSYRKLITETRTRGGWDVQHWGEQLIEVRVEGRTGGLIKQVKPIASASDGGSIAPKIDITQSVAWKRLNELKKLYDNDHKEVSKEGFVTKLGFNYYDRFYVGYFSEFSGPNADAEKPYIMNYSFTFKVESEGEYILDSSLDSLNLPQTRLVGEQ